MKNVICILMFLGCLSYTVTAQQEFVADNLDIHERTSGAIASSAVYFRFNAMDQSSYVNQVDGNDAGTHFLGDYMAKKQYLLKKMHCYKEPIAPGSSATKTIYRKPDIYFSVKKIEKYLKEGVKNKTFTADIAKEDFSNVLEVALNVLDEDTESLEFRINSVNGNPEKLLKIFVNEVELNK